MNDNDYTGAVEILRDAAEVDATSLVRALVMIVGGDLDSDTIPCPAGHVHPALIARVGVNVFAIVSVSGRDGEEHAHRDEHGDENQIMTYGSVERARNAYEDGRTALHDAAKIASKVAQVAQMFNALRND